jgi:hypothetical protein
LTNPIGKLESAEAPQNKCQVALSRADVLNLKKIAATEVDASLKGDAFDSQVKGVVDTVLNRVASGVRGCSVAAVGNARWRFSRINSTLRTDWGSLENTPASAVNPPVAAAVDAWLDARIAGQPSSVGDNLNYLNPYYSSANSMRAWGR